MLMQPLKALEIICQNAGFYKRKMIILFTFEYIFELKKLTKLN